MSEQFDDVTPVTINEEEPQLCQILYNDEYRETMGVLLALLNKKEYSERALALTQKGILLLASHYTLWNYRYNILVNLDKDLFEELDWCEQIALDNEKNYQIWNYRQLIIELIISRSSKDDSQLRKFDPYHEYPILAAMLAEDAKNHHVWLYRKWLVERFDLFDDERELDFVNGCIQEDVRNNSAWTHRFFIKFHKLSSNEKDEKSCVIIENEIDFVKKEIPKSPQNISSWNYLRGIFKKYDLDITSLKDFCQEFANFDDQEDASVTQLIQSSVALEMLADIYKKEKNIGKAKDVYTLLADKYDPIRHNYWNYLKERI